jgi:SAM-dependent methyltransferase
MSGVRGNGAAEAAPGANRTLGAGTRGTGSNGAGSASAGSNRAGSHRADARGADSHAAGAGARTGLAGRVGSGRDEEPFTRYALDYAAARPGQVIALLQAGCTTAGSELDLAWLRAEGCDLAVSLIDEDSKITRAAVGAHQDLCRAALGDMRRIPLVPRSVDIVQCSLLLERISHADLVLGRLIEAIRPGGLLLLRSTDRDSAAGFLDRAAPGVVRALAWRWLRPGQPGPYPALHERLVSARGIQAFATRHGLVIAHRQVRSRLDGRRRAAGLLAARKLVSALSRGRLACAHDELRYVIRKPEDQFARVL